MTIRATFSAVIDTFVLDVDLAIPARGVTAVFGPSGSGKTRLLRAIAGLDRLPGGRLEVGEEVWQDGDRFVPTHLRSIGYVFQEPSLFPHLTVRGNLEYGFVRVGAAERSVSLGQAVAFLDLEDLLGRRPDGLSGGERQRVAIARALAASPRLLLMDEPLTALDEMRKREILPYLERLHRDLEIPVIYVSHSPDEVARLADHLVLLDRGRIEGSGPIAEVLTRLDLPLARGSDAEALLQARVVRHDEDYHLTHLEFPGGRVTVPGIESPIGASVRLRIAARDVSLTLDEQTDTSILNIFPAVVDDLAPCGEAQVIVRLLSGGMPLLARVTRKSSKVLGLERGKRLFVQAKSVAVLS